MLDRFVDAAVQAEGQAVARAIDRVDERRELGSAIAQQVQHRPEHLAPQFGEVVDLDQGRRNEAAEPGCRRQNALRHLAALGRHRVDVRLDGRAGFGRDDRPDVGRQAIGVADRQFGHRALEHGQHAVGDVVLHAQHAQRRAALPPGVEGRQQDVADHLLRQRRRVDDHDVLAAGLGDQRNRLAVGVQPPGEPAADQPGDFGRPGEQDAGRARVGDQRCADGSVAGQQLQRAGRHAAVVQQRDGRRGDERRFLGRFGDDDVAGCERRCHLAGEDRQRKVPRADAGNRAERAVAVGRQVLARLQRVVAQEVHRFADFAHGVRQRLAGFANDQAEQRRHARLEQVGGARQAPGALGWWCRLPDRRVRRRMAERGGDRLGPRVVRDADEVAAVGGIADLARHAGGRAVGQQRLRLVDRFGARQQRAGQRGQALLVAQVDAARVRPVRPEQLTRQRQPRMRRADRGDCRSGGYRIGDQRVDRHRRVGDPVDERGVGAVLEQPPDQVGEQGFVRADRRVDPAWPIQLVGPDHLVVQRLAHAVQALELVLAGMVVRPGHRVDRGQRLRIVRRELREHGIGRDQQLARAGQVGHVGMDLAGVDREVFEAVDLGALDLAVPVGAFHQPDHQTVAAASGEVDQQVDDERRALLIGLDHEADAVPVGQIGVEAQRFEQVDRDLEPVGLLGIDVQSDVVAPRQQAERLQPRQQFRADALPLAARVARVQRRQLDRDAGALVDAAPAGRLADGVDRLLVVAVVASRVGRGGGGFAEHVVRVSEPSSLLLAAVGQRLADRLAANELLAEHPHGHVDALADQRFAAPGDQPGQRRRQARFAAGRGQPAGDQQAPGRGVHE